MFLTMSYKNQPYQHILGRENYIYIYIYKRKHSQLGIIQEGKAKGPIWIFCQPDLHTHSNPSKEALEALHAPCPQFTTEHAIPAIQIKYV